VAVGGVAAAAAMEHRGSPVGVASLAVAGSFSIPIAEVSGLAIRHVAGRLELLAGGDATAELARATLTDGVPGRWTITRVEGVKDREGSQLEAVATDADGRIIVLREHPTALLSLDEPGTRVERELDRDITADPSWHDVARDDPNPLARAWHSGRTERSSWPKRSGRLRCSSAASAAIQRCSSGTGSSHQSLPKWSRTSVT
jgi:hypothetical protein